MNTFRFYLTALLLALLVQSVAAQDYVITHRGDTIAGEIRMYNLGTERKVQVNAAGKKKTIIPIFQVKSLLFEGLVFHPVKGPSGYQFMKLIKDGYLSLYGFQLPNQAAFDGLILLKKDGSFIEVPNLNFKKVMKRFLEDCPATVDRIEDGSFVRKDLHAIIDHYNGCVDERSQITVTKETPPAVVPSPGPENKTATKALDQLEQRIKDMDDFAGKNDAVDMITEIRNKKSRGERVPNFLVEGLKAALKEKGVDAELNTALELVTGG